MKEGHKKKVVGGDGLWIVEVGGWTRGGRMNKTEEGGKVILRWGRPRCYASSKRTCSLNLRV